MIYITAPDVGSIVGCWFPYTDDIPPEPGKEFRPCLVLQIIKRIDKEAVDLVLAYGTGQTSDCNIITRTAASFEVENGEGGNTLEETTKFDLKKIAQLPLEPRFFAHHSNPERRYSKFGNLTKDKLELVKKLLKEKNISLDRSNNPKVCIIERKQAKK